MPPSRMLGSPSTGEGSSLDSSMRLAGHGHCLAAV